MAKRRYKRPKGKKAVPMKPGMAKSGTGSTMVIPKADSRISEYGRKIMEAGILRFTLHIDDPWAAVERRTVDIFNPEFVQLAKSKSENPCLRY